MNYPETVELDIDKPLFAGVKFHSHRTLRPEIDGEQQYGLGYASESNVIQKVLDRLPANSIVNMHTQGSASLHNQAHARSLYKYALSNPALKFFISHAGCYGAGSFAPVERYFPPTHRKEMTQTQKQYNSMLSVHHFSTMLIADAVYVAQSLPNVWLNTAILYPIKREPLKATDKWGIGSDYPFCQGTPSK